MLALGIMTQVHSDVMYRLLVEGVIDYAIYMLSPEGIVSNWNAGARRAKGYTRDEIVGKHFSCFYSEEEQALDIPARGLETARAEGRFEAEGWRIRKDGSKFWAHVVIDAIHDDGELVGFAKITRDCTEQRQLRLDREAQERRFRLLDEGVTDYAIYMLDIDGNVASWNAGAERAKGYTQAEILGRHFSCFYSLEEQAAGLPQRGLATARDTGKFQSEGWRYRKDGSRFWSSVLIDAIHDENNAIIGYAKITRDVTERREQEERLLEAKELAEQYSEQMKSLSVFLDMVVSNIPSSVIVKDAVSRKILLANRQAERLFGSTSHDMMGKRPHDCLSGPVSDYFDQLADEALRAEGVHRHEEQIETVHGMRALRTSTLTVHGSDPRSRYVMLIADDVTDENAAHAQIHFMAHHDTLTGLPNRRMFRQRLNEALQSSSANSQSAAVLCLDLDNFKMVNDTLGHQFGDELLRALTTRLSNVLRDRDTLSRLGGDEFAVVLPHMARLEDVERTAMRLIEAVRPEFSVDGQTVSVGLSIGIAMAPGDHTGADTLRRYADLALYDAKRNGRNQFAFFTPAMAEAARKRRLIEMDLRDAIMARQLQLHYQPIIDSAGRSITGYEALMRWQHPVNGIIMPLEFIPIAEETGLIHEVGAFALHEACVEAMTWQTGQTVAVNLSPVQFKNSAFVSSIESALHQSGLPPQRLELEITESVLLENSEANIETLRKIKALGVKIALDDFGTGYSSLSYLRSFPFDKIKIDKSFTRDLDTSREALAIIRAINGIGRSLEIPTTAEGVETSDQLDQLQTEGCSHFQGYFFGKPLPAKERLQ